MTIWFDMDGNIANLYGVENWLPMLRAFDATPYLVAKPLLNMSLLARHLNRLQRKGYRIGIISWCSKTSTPQYDADVTAAKLAWLGTHLKSVKFDTIHIVPYGVPKENFMATPDDILFDDEEKNRNNWRGTAYDETNILNVLRTL